MTKRLVTFGRQPTSPPEGNFRQVLFPELARVDEGTNEGMLSRWLHSEGGDARGLPRTIYFQKHQSDGHSGSVAIGSLHEVTIDGESGSMSGKGWLADVPEARDALPFIISKALFHNSVDLAEVTVREEVTGDWFSDDFHVDLHFDKWKLAATTFVGKPAFADAHGVIPDEITAALESDEPIVVDSVPVKIHIITAQPDEEITAAMSSAPPWDYFHRPEPEQHHKIIVGEPDDNGWIPVYGHLALWDRPHDGYDGREVKVPRPRDNYASFNQPGVLTDRGMVETGPICLYGGHVPLTKAMDSVENAWCDVRVTAGKHGPWLCGVARPDVTEEQLYAARASRISGHWKQGRLKAIMSVNVPGFEVPGSGFSFRTNARGELAELVASYPGDTLPAEALSLSELNAETVTKIINNINWHTPPQFVTPSGTIYITTTTETTDITNIEIVEEEPNKEWADLSFERERLALLLELDDA